MLLHSTVTHARDTTGRPAVVLAGNGTSLDAFRRVSTVA